MDIEKEPGDILQSQENKKRDNIQLNGTNSQLFKNVHIIVLFNAAQVDIVWL